MTLGGARAFLARLFKAFLDDAVDDVAAMMTYYAIFALFPMLLFILSLTLLVLPPGVVDDAVQMFGRALPRDVYEVVSKQIAAAQAATDGNVAIFGGVLALWGASRGAAALTFALNRVFTVQETRSFWWRQLLAILVTAMVALLIVIALALLLLGPTIGHRVADRYDLGDTFDAVWGVSAWVFAGGLMTLVWALLYKWLPNHHAPLRVFTPGAAVGVLLWVAVSRVMTFFVSHLTDYEATYGALASAVTFLLWLWVSNLALLMGAEISDVLHGRDVRERSPLVPRKVARQFV
jgi:membrane protein